MYSKGVNFEKIQYTHVKTAEHVSQAVWPVLLKINPPGPWMIHNMYIFAKEFDFAESIRILK